VQEQLPEVPGENLILEPERRDLGAATGLAFFTLFKRGVTGPLYFQWSDNYVGNPDGLRQAIEGGRQLVTQNPNQVIFIGQKPRFASENLGWIEQGDRKGYTNGIPYFAFHSIHYRPTLEVCRQMFESGCFTWNSGFFMSTVEFIVDTYRTVAPEISELATKIADLGINEGTRAQRVNLYKQMPVMHFDEAFLMKLKPEQALVMNIDLEWTDPGTLYGLKEALAASSEANVTQGKVVDLGCSDSLIINEEDKVLSVMGMEGAIVVNTDDSTLVISKDSVRHIKKLLDELRQRGFEEIL
jgi:mannose-1-phosphate guanylyltransferase